MSESLLQRAREGDAEGVRRLLEAGAEADAVGEDGPDATPLRAAAEAGHYEVVQALIAAGADVNRVGGDGATPVTVAGRAGKWPVMRLLAQNGGDFHIKDGDGKNGHFYLKRCRGKRTRAAIQAAFESRGKSRREGVGTSPPPSPPAEAGDDAGGDDPRASLPLAPDVD